MRPKFSRPELFVFSLPLLLYVLTLHSNEFGPLYNIVATQFSMWNYHNFGIGPLNNITGSGVSNPDIFPYHGNNFDVYPPGLTLLSYPFAVAGFILDGGVQSASGFAVLFDEFFVALCAAFASVLIYRICRWYAPAAESMLAAFVLAFATSVWPFATVTFDHDVTLLFSLASVYFAMRYFRDKSSIFILILSGICLGVSSLVDYVSVLFVIPLAAYLLYGFMKKSRGVPRNLIALGTFVISFLVLASINFLYNYSIFDHYFTFPPQFWIYAQEPYQSGLPGVLSRFSLSGLASHAIFNLVSPYRGILLLSPVLILGFYGLYKMERLKGFRSDGVFLLAFFLTNFLPYSAWAIWDGGGAYGPRFLIYGLPYLVIPIAFVLSRTRSRAFQALFFTLFAVSTVMQGLGALTYAYQPTASSVLVYQPFSFAFPEVLSFNLGVWWFQSGLITNEVIAASIMVAIFAIIFVLTFSIVRGDRSIVTSSMIVQPAMSPLEPFD